MPEYPPYMNAYGLVPKVLQKIKEAETPDRFTQDFLSTKLSFGGGSAKAFIPFAKRIGLLGPDGAPTDIYKAFRNKAHSGAAMARAIRKGYAELYSRNEYLHDLDKKKLEGLIIEQTGLEAGHQTIRAICGSFDGLKSFAEFDKKDIPIPKNEKASEDNGHEKIEGLSGVKLGLSYTINLVLPKTDDVGVFNAIFKALREHLLTK
jgi:hypothetical protein